MMMEGKKRNRLLFWALIILVVINLSALGTIIYQNYFSRSCPFPQPLVGAQTSEPNLEHFHHFMHQRLNLSDQQEETLKKLDTRHFEATRIILDSLQQLRGLMLNELERDRMDTVLLDSYAQKVGLLHCNLKRITTAYFIGIKAMCTPDQNKKLNLFFSKMRSCCNPDGPSCARHGWGAHDTCRMIKERPVNNFFNQNK